MVKHANYLSKYVIVVLVPQKKNDESFAKKCIVEWLDEYHGKKKKSVDTKFQRGGIIREAFVFDFSDIQTTGENFEFNSLNIHPSKLLQCIHISFSCILSGSTRTTF